MALSIVEKLALSSELQKTPTLYGLLQTIGEKDGLDTNTTESILVALRDKSKSDPAAFSKMEADLKANPSLANSIRVAAIGNPSSVVDAIKQYSGGDMGAYLPAKGSYPEAESKVAGAQQQPTSLQGQASPARKAPEIEAIELFAEKIADYCVSKLGIDKAKADGFVNKIKSDPVLAQKIAYTMKTNPSFIEDLSKLSESDKKLSGIALHVAKSRMNTILSDPGKLTNDAFVKERQAELWMADKSMGELTQTAFGQIRQKHFDGGLGGVFSGFKGDNKVIVMGGGLMGFINMEAFRANFAQAQAMALFSPNQMFINVQKGENGKFKDEIPVLDKDNKPIMGADGKPITKDEIRGKDLVAFKTVDGKEMKAVASIGYEARQGKDGNFRVPIITDIDKVTGMPTKIDRVIMTPEVFAEYRAKVETATGKTFAVDRYVAPQPPAPPMVVSVDPQTGVANDPVPLKLQQQPPAAGAQSYPVRPGGLDNAANEPERALKA